MTTHEEEEEELYEDARTLGLERWVQFAFVMVAILTFFIGDKLITYVWQFWAEPNALQVSGAAAILGIVTAYALYRHPKVRPMADEVASELSKVTWPTRPETWRNTVVVVITSVIAAAYLGLFDTLWSTFTDLIYTTTT